MYQPAINRETKIGQQTITSPLAQTTKLPINSQQTNGSTIALKIKPMTTTGLIISSPAHKKSQQTTTIPVAPTAPKSAFGSATGSTAWQTVGLERLRVKEAEQAKKQEKQISSIAQTLGEVRGLTQQVRPTVNYEPIKRPASAATILPPINPSVSASSPTTNSQSTSILSPVAGVDDPSLAAFTNLSIVPLTSTPNSDSSFRLYSSQRLHDLAVSKSQRHFALWNSYQSWRGLFEHDLNENVDEVARQLRKDLDAFEQPIHQLLHETMVNETKLMAMTKQELQQHEEAFFHTYELKEQRIQRGLDELQALEEKRSTEMKHALGDLMKGWIDIAHLSVEECERSLQQEVKEVNIYLLKNSSTTHELSVVLRSELVLKSRELNLATWQARVAEWKRLRHQFYLKQFRERFLEDFTEPKPDEIDPQTGHRRNEINTRTGLPWSAPLPERTYPFQYSRQKRKAYTALMEVEQEFQTWNEQQLDIILQQFTPTGAAATENHMVGVKKEETSLNDRLLHVQDQFHNAYDVYDSRLEQRLSEIRSVENELQLKLKRMVDELRDNLKDTAHVTTDEGIEAVLGEEIQPLITARNEREQSILAHIERSLKYYDTNYLTQVDHFFRWFLEVTHKWDDFKLALSEKNEDAYERLYEVRDEFTEEEQRLEKELAEEIELLKCEPSLEGLDNRLARIKAIVGPATTTASSSQGGAIVATDRTQTEGGALERLYLSFYQRSCVLLREHPTLLQQLTESFSIQFAHIFGLRHPAEEEQDRARAEEAARAAAAEALRLEEEADALLTKRDRAKKEKEKERLKAQKEKEEKDAADALLRTKLAQIKAKLKEDVEKAKAELKESKTATTTSAATASTTTAADAGSSPTKTRVSSGKPLKKSDEELLKEIEQMEAVEKVLANITAKVSTSVFYSLKRYQTAVLNAESLVKEIKEIPLEDLGKVEIQSGDIFETEPPKKTNTHLALSQLKEDDIKGFIVMPKPPAPVEEPTTNKRKSSSSRTRTSTSKVEAPPAPVEPTGPTLPYLNLPADVVQFQILTSQSNDELIQKILSGKWTATTAGFTSSTGGGSTTVDASSGPSLSLLNGTSLETAAEKEQRIAAELEAAASALEKEITAAPVAATTLESPQRPNSSRGLKSPTAKGRKPTKAELAALAAAEAAEAAAKQAELVAAQREELEKLKAAALAVSATQIPLDQKAEAVLDPIKFPTSVMTRWFEKVREAYLVTCELVGREECDLIRMRNESILMDLVKEFHLNLRKYAPRFNRISVDVYEARAKMLNNNLKTYQRLIERLSANYTKSVLEWEELFLQGEQQLYLIQQKVKEGMKSLPLQAPVPDPTPEPTGSTSSRKGKVEVSAEPPPPPPPPIALGRLYEVKTKVTQQVHAFSTVMTNQIMNVLTERFRSYQHSLETQIQQFIQLCQMKQFDHSASANESGLIGVNTYHPDEVTHYSGLLHEFSDGCGKLIAGHQSQLARFKERHDQLLELKDFTALYNINLTRWQWENEKRKYEKMLASQPVQEEKTETPPPEEPKTKGKVIAKKAPIKKVTPASPPTSSKRELKSDRKET